jgi:hypothetical protein
MLVSKTIEIEIDRKSWPSSRVPPEISALPSTWDANIVIAMLHTAIWTRPPRYTGLHISDFWAWLRYERAISHYEDLRLREEWEGLDAHQKTILSDDFGVGFSTYFLTDNLGFTGFADTLHVLKLFPDFFKLKNLPKSGPGKTPDFLALDKSDSISVLECKGTQSSRAYLRRSTSLGISQKKNVISNHLKIKHCLVAGLFVPTFSCSANALLLLRDPPLPGLIQGLSKVPLNDLKTSISQIVLAKHFSLIGLTTTANALSSTHLKNRERLPENSLAEMKQFSENFENRRDLFDINLPVQLSKAGEKIFPDQNFSFSMSLNFDRLSFLREQRPYEGFQNFHESLKEEQWKFSKTKGTFQMISPFGFNMFLKSDSRE